MDINIRDSIKKNFKDCEASDIRSSIVESINDKEEITLPGLGVLFELMWLHSNENVKEDVIKAIKKGL